MACWITFFADGDRRNSSRCDLYSRVSNAGFFRADRMINSLKSMYGNSPCLPIAAVYDHRIGVHFWIFWQCTSMSNSAQLRAV